MWKILKEWIIIIIIIIRTNCIQVKIVDTRQNTKCRVYCNIDETIFHIISECSKQVQKENKNKHIKRGCNPQG